MAFSVTLAVGSMLLLWLGSVCVYLLLLYAYGERQSASTLSERC